MSYKSNKAGLLLATTIVLVFLAPAFAADSARIKDQFQSPSRHYSSGPLWVWNDMLTESQIRSTLNDLASQKVRQVWVHPRPGLMTPYLSEDWFRLWNIALDEAEKLDMNVWIYDENSYPSGFAGGLVPDAMPESRGRGLSVNKTDKLPGPNSEYLAVYRQTEEGLRNITDEHRAGDDFPAGPFYVATVRRASPSPWYGGKTYVDLIYPGVTEKFIEITFEPYRENIGRQFGKRVPGIFTDEPQLRPAGGLPWTDDLPKVFEDKWGYSLMDHLPSLNHPIGDFKRIRHNYFYILNRLFIERWAKPCHDFCEENDLQWTGHYWEHEWPNCIGVPDNMAMYAWHQRPAIDTLMNRYNEGTRAQFGNARAVRELASVANQMDRKHTLCEAYGAGGWDLRFEDMKRIGDWLYVLGVNTLNEHLSYITIRGARKRDHPQSFSYHTPWWPHYHTMAEYFTRLSLVISSGKQSNRILLIEPTTTAWMYQADASQKESLMNLANNFQNLILALEAAQVEYDLASEDVIARHGSIDGSSLEVGRARYTTVVLPPLIENIESTTLQLLAAFRKAEGNLISCGTLPNRIDGRLSDKARKLTGIEAIDAEDLPAHLRDNHTNGLRIIRDESDKGILFHQRRQLADGDFLFLVNTSITDPSSGSIRADAKSVQEWDLQTGKVTPYHFTPGRRQLRTDFELPPCGSLMLFLSDAPARPSPEKSPDISEIPASNPTSITREKQNVLTLDYVDVTAAGETKENVYVYKANRFAFAQNGLRRNPWDSSVQFRDELITKTFPTDSGFEVSYKFTIEQEIPDSLHIVIERPDLYSIFCNGRVVAPEKDAWYLDKSFGRIDLRNTARLGRNTVTIKASPFTIYHELEAAYLIGDFRLRPVDSGFVVIPDAPLTLGSPWNAQGHPFYAAGVNYSQSFEIKEPSGKYFVKLPDWYGSVAHATVNGKPAGNIAYRPWRLDITEFLEPGTNSIEVTVIGTLKNTLGPHHVGPTAGAAWPNMFQRAPETGPPPGDKYDTIAYGLFESFTLENQR